MFDARTLCLGCVAFRDCSGYEIRKVLTEGPVSHFAEASFGSIYPALRALEADGLIVEVAGSEGRADKRIFRATEAGRQVLMANLLGPTDRDRLRSDFAFKMLFADWLDTEDLARLMAEREAWLDEQLRRWETCTSDRMTPGQLYVHGLGRAMYHAERDYIAAHRDALIRSCGSGEQADDLPLPTRSVA